MSASTAALSTMWGIGRFPSLAAFFTAADALGFGRYELNHAVTPAMLDGSSLDGRRIASVHEPCPAQLSIGELRQRGWLVSSTDEESRRRAVAAVRRSIDLAHRLGAGTVIVHPGRVDVDPALETALVDLYGQDRSGQPEYTRARERLAEARAARVEINMRSVRRSLAELAEHAARRGIRLGLENRFHYLEIPLPDELDDLLHSGCGEVVGYWHDVGHAQVLENLGFCSHEGWLRRFSHRVIGVHLHDVAGVLDHLAPGLGRMDWPMVARYLPAAALRTCELQAFNSPREVAAGVRRLVETRCLAGP